MDKMKTPPKALIDLTDDEGYVAYVGTLENGIDVYQWTYNEPAIVGFPEVYLHNEDTGEIQKIEGFESFEYLRPFYDKEDTEE